MRPLIILTAATLLPAPTALAQQAADIEGAVATITADDVRQRIGLLADDSLMGRDTPSPGLERAASWIAAEFRRFGLAPGGDENGFIQRYPLVRRQVDVAASRVALREGDGWRFGEDVVHLQGHTPADGGGSGGGVSGQVVFLAGTPSGSDAFETLPDLEEGVLVWLVPEARAGVPNLRLVISALRQLQDRPPAAVILLTTRPDNAWRRALAGMNEAELVPGWRTPSATPILEMREATLAPVLASLGVDLTSARSGAFAARRISQLQLDIAVSLRTVEEIGAPNVVGVLRGSDPALRDEYLVFSAHMDHVGVGRPVNGDSIYNGADDDASGTTAVIELAQAFAALESPPRRSMIFVAVSGEEKGLWGSEYFAANPPVPVSQMIANVNADMVGRNWPDTIVVIGKEHSDLGATLNRVNAAHPELGMTAIDDLWPDERFYFRSDHFNFARRGVPILFFFNGTHPQYHQPSDEPQLIDAEKEARIIKLMFYLGLDVANRTERPQWDPASYQQIVDPDLTGAR